MTCEQLVTASLEPASYVRQDPRESIGFDSMSVRVYEDQDRRMREIKYEQCGGARSRWAVFGTESP